MNNLHDYGYLVTAPTTQGPTLDQMKATMRRVLKESEDLRRKAQDFVVRLHRGKHIPATSQFWEFDQHRFVEYEDSDRPWCSYFGIGGRWVERPAYFKIGNDFYSHESVYDCIVEALDRQGIVVKP